MSKHHWLSLTDVAASQLLIFNADVVACVQVGFDELLPL